MDFNELERRHATTLKAMTTASVDDQVRLSLEAGQLREQISVALKQEHDEHVGELRG